MPADKPVKVLLAEPRGFCAGVVRAIEIVERALLAHGAPVYVRHEIVHNRHVVEALKSKGAVFVEDLAGVPAGAVTIFSAHGVSRQVEDEAEERGLYVLDATCPLVAKVHKEARRFVAQGRTVVLIGHAGHPEVEGTLGQIEGPVHLVEDEEDVAALAVPDDALMAYVTQTTLSVDDTTLIIDALSRRFVNLVGPSTNDICYATQNRQRAVRALAETCDLILVVGAANSSNSNRLREIGESLGVRSHLVARGCDIDPAWLAGVGCVGITAGASAPEVLVQEVVERLGQLLAIEVNALAGLKETIEFQLPAELSRPHARVGLRSMEGFASAYSE